MCCNRDLRGNKIAELPGWLADMPHLETVHFDGGTVRYGKGGAEGT